MKKKNKKGSNVKSRVDERFESRFFFLVYIFDIYGSEEKTKKKKQTQKKLVYT